MEYLKSRYIKDTFVVSNLPCKKYHCSSLLLVGNSVKEEYTKTLKSIIKFNLDSLDISKVKEAFLKIYVRKKQTCNLCKFPMNFKIGINNSYVHIPSTCWNNSPSYDKSNIEIIINKSDIGKYINVDITDVVNMWLSEEKNNYGLTIYSNEIRRCGIINFSSVESSKPPFLEYTI